VAIYADSLGPGATADAARERALAPTTSGGYKAFAKKHKFEADIVELEAGALGCFVGSKAAKTTLVWFHGWPFRASLDRPPAIMFADFESI
jgi:hypothetical protein